MKFLDRINLKIFSIIIIVVSIIVILFSFELIEDFEFLEIIRDGEAIYITDLICIILILLSIKSLFFSKGKKEDISDGILLENSNGKLFITKESIINMIETEIQTYNEILNQVVQIGFDDDKNLFVSLTIVINKDINIKELSGKIQNSIKIAVKKSADVDIKEIDIKIKNVEDKDLKNN